MFNVCPQCGEYRPDKTVLKDESLAVCPVCGFRQKFLHLPLFIVSGSSGVGKTATCLALGEKTKDFVVMESDILWIDAFNQPETEYREYREIWLRLCKNISQAGKPVVLCGVGIPNQFEPCVERRYFSAIHYLTLVCDAPVLEARLKSRPEWRGSGTEENIKIHLAFNEWLKENAEQTNPAMTLLDTSQTTIEETVAAVEQWIRRHV